VNNVNIVINNLILKYVEDDIVLSVNITSAECYTVDEFWDRAFMDISGKQIFFDFRYHSGGNLKFLQKFASLIKMALYIRIEIISTYVHFLPVFTLSFTLKS